MMVTNELGNDLPIPSLCLNLVISIAGQAVGTLNSPEP